MLIKVVIHVFVFKSVWVMEHVSNVRKSNFQKKRKEKVLNPPRGTKEQCILLSVKSPLA